MVTALELDHHVDREDLAAIGAGRALVEPALDHHEQAGEAHAAERPQRDPHQRVHRSAMSSTTEAAIAAQTAKVRMCPTRRTMCGMLRQPTTKPAE